MASPLMSPPHNGTPFIYFTERMSSVISTALKSYYLYVNDEWIECGCQEQYLFVSCGQPWLFFFNSISPPPLSVIDNWCGLTSLSEDVEFFNWDHGLARHHRAFTGCAFYAVFSWWMTVWHRRDRREPQLLGRKASKIKNNEASSVV